MKMSNDLEIVRICPTLQSSLTDFFMEIADSDDSVFFHPHPFTSQESERICHYTGKDLYYAIALKSRILAYGMLRGWDEGYPIPSLGIIVRKEVRGKGLGKLLILHLHAAALFRGSKKIRLKVYKGNIIAKHMYETLNYIFQNEEKDQLIGFCDL